MEVEFSPTAKKEFLAAVAYLLDRNPTAADNFLDRVDALIDQLERFPESGSYIPEFPNADYRQVFPKPYRFFYRIKDNVVWITAVYYERQIPIRLEQ